MFAGFGALEAGMIFKKIAGKIAFGTILLAVVIAELSANWPEVDASSNYLVHDYTATILDNLKPNAIIISYQWDYFVAASYYFQYVKHVAGRRNGHRQRTAPPLMVLSADEKKSSGVV